MIDLKLKLDPSFMDAEERFGFQVSKKRKEVWAVELDLLLEFDRICKEHGLTYFVGAGTMLGAVRHQGFIPWDDDIDIYMLRDEYDMLMDLSSEFRFPYFMQNSLTENHLLRSYTRIRNSLTTGTTLMDEIRFINKGIFIDIFPIDGISKNFFFNWIQGAIYGVQKRLFSWYNLKFSDFHPIGFLQKCKFMVKKALVSIFVNNRVKFFNLFDNNLKKYSVDETILWGNRTLVFECPKTRRPLSDYQDLITMPFEFLEVPVPRNYDALLRQQYGDYTKIPENKGGNMHGELIISTDYAYDDPRRTET